MYVAHTGYLEAQRQASMSEKSEGIHMLLLLWLPPFWRSQEQGPRNSSWQGARSTPVVDLGLEHHTARPPGVAVGSTEHQNVWFMHDDAPGYFSVVRSTFMLHIRGGESDARDLLGLHAPQTSIPRISLSGAT
ncbi:hypothetical protein TNCV_1475631 [Trichonephila clavipes]|nr:hypothetical protein TNCV_1475631 [Trichonephila clavipes]